MPSQNPSIANFSFGPQGAVQKGNARNSLSFPQSQGSGANIPFVVGQNVLTSQGVPVGQEKRSQTFNSVQGQVIQGFESPRNTNTRPVPVPQPQPQNLIVQPNTNPQSQPEKNFPQIE